MYIQTEGTPNPAALKFVPGREVMSSGTAHFPDAESAKRSPLAKRLFGVDAVSAVFFGSDFITVTKADEAEWQMLKPAILDVIMQHYASEDPLFCNGAPDDEEDAAEEDGEDAENAAQIKELIESRVRPAVAQDGGDIIYRGFEKGIVFLQLRGACLGCPSSTATLKAGIEHLLKHHIPEVIEVRAVA